MNEEQIAKIPSAPQWALSTGHFGQAAVLAGLVLFVASLLLWAVAGSNRRVTQIASIGFVIGCFSLFAAMASLTALFVNNQFEFKYVYSHGGADTSLSYKIASVWTAQEGSFLLWGCTSALFGAVTLWGAGIYRRWYGTAYATFLAAICGILAYESPFNIIPDAIVNGRTLLPADGSGMTPALQNYWVIIHPPTIFMGFGSLTVMFSYAVAAMITGNLQDWVAKVRPWTIVSASILGLGLCMGGMWAYETQGWGGFWQWDPVENVSFVPWLFCAALIHGLIVQATKKKWTSANLFLAGLPFLTFVYGTFLTRSGLLDKVSNHSFASMDKSALVILRGFMIAVAAFFVALYAVRGRDSSKPVVSAEAKGIHREGFYRFSVLTVSLFATVVAFGMSWPVITALRGGQGSAIEEPTYHMVVAWFFVPVMLAMAVAPFVTWPGMTPKQLWIRGATVLNLSMGLTGLMMLALTNPTIGVHLAGGETVRMPFGTRMALVPWLAILLFTCVVAAFGNIWRIAEMVKRTKLSLGGFVAHLGFSMLMAGLILSRGFEQKASDFLQAGGSIHLLDYSLTYKGMRGKNLADRDGKVLIDVARPDGSHFEARPGFYMYENGPNDIKSQVWPHVEKEFSHDVYLALQPPITEVWEKPQTFKLGETRTVDGLTVSYLSPTMEGPLGQIGAKFGAKLKVVTPEGTYDAHPTLTVKEQGLVPDVGPVGPNYRIFLSRMDAADKSATVQMMFAHPIYPVDLYYKPLTSLVWLGTGIMTLGGFLSALARRQRPKSPAKPLTSAEVE